MTIQSTIMYTKFGVIAIDKYRIGKWKEKPHIDYLCERNVFYKKYNPTIFTSDYLLRFKCLNSCYYIHSILSIYKHDVQALSEAQKNLWNGLRYLHTWMNTICNRTTAWKHGHSLTTSLSKKLQQFIILTKVLLSLFGRPHKSFL